MEDLSDLRADEEPPTTHNTFQAIYYSLTDLKVGKLLAAFRKYIGGTFLLAGILAIVSNLLQFSGPLMINRILAFLNSDPDNPEPLSNGITYVSILIGCY